MSEALPSLSGAETPLIVRDDMQNLRAALDHHIPPKREPSPNLLIATWNIREFSSLNETWDGSGRGPKRDWRALWAITEIVSRFDVIAIQEAGGDLKALRTMLKTLGSGWNFVMTDVTLGKAGGGERLAFLFDARRIQLSGLACELVVPPEWLKEGEQDALRDQFARTPYAVGFRAGSTTFVLVTLHVKYGDVPTDRVAEVRGIARWMADWAKHTTDWDQNFIVLGDFNIDRRDDPLFQAFISQGLTVAQPLVDLPRSIFDKGPGPKNKYYDQIAWFTDDRRALLHMQLKNGGNFDFRPHVFTDADLSPVQLSFRLSDHFPMWVEFDLG